MTDRRRQRRFLAAYCAAAIGVWCGAGGGAVGDDVLSVTLAGGRTFTGNFDARSDGTRLWLCFSRGRSSILRPIEWSSVVAAVRNGRPTTVDDLRRAAATMEQKNAPTPPKTLAAGHDEVAPSKPVGGVRPWTVPSTRPSFEGRIPGTSPRIVTLSLDARLAQWDADVEADGLLLTVAALSADGVAVPVDATLEVELVGPVLPPLTRGDAVPILGRWTRRLTAGDATAGDGSYRESLPFQSFDPEFAPGYYRHGLVHVRMLVPGQGTFDASVDAVSLRGFTPVRESIEQAYGTRFLPGERTGSGPREVNTAAQ